MITIDRDNSRAGNKYKVTANDPGFGKWSKDALTMEQALALVAHYFGQPHEHAVCQNCEELHHKKFKAPIHTAEDEQAARVALNNRTY